MAAIPTPSSTMPLSRLMSLLSLGYGVYALVAPRHLGRQLEVPEGQLPAYDRMAHTYAGRDLAVSALGILGPDVEAVTTSMVLRIVGDVSDAAVLSVAAPSGRVRAKMLAATLGWAALNTAALVADRRRLAS
jgi:hypothetical protein